MSAATPIDVSITAIHAARSVYESLMASRYIWQGRDREPSYRDHFVTIAIDDLHHVASELGFMLISRETGLPMQATAEEAVP